MKIKDNKRSKMGLFPSMPFTKFIYIINLDQDELSKRLKSVVGKRKILNLGKPDKPFFGKIDEKGFKITPTLHRRHNSFAPVIIGKFSTQNANILLKITMRMHLLVNIFMIYLCLFSAFGTVSSIMDNEFFTALIFIIIGIFSYLMSSFFFWYEAKNAKIVLDEILNLA